MDYEHVKKQLGYGIQTESKDNAIKALEQLQAKVADLEEENARLKAESRDASLGLNDYYGRKLAAEQLNNKRLREALEAVIKVHGYESGIPVEAISTKVSTEALDEYVEEKAKEWRNAYEKSAEAAMLLSFKVDELTRQRDLAVEALEKANEGIKAELSDNWTCSSYHPKLFAGEKAIDEALSAIKESEGK